MVKPPKIRHSRSRKEPLTIELGPDEVSRIEQPSEAEAAESEAGPEAAAAESTDPVADNEFGPTADASKAEPAAQSPARDETPAASGLDTPAAGAEAEPAESREPPVADSKLAEADRPAEEETVNLMGSEWPPESAATGETPSEGERIRHAFGRDPDTPPPGAATRADRSEPKIHSRPEERKSMPAIAAGIAGGIIALLGAGGLQFAGLLPAPGPGAIAPADDGEAIAALEGEMEALKREVATVKEASGGDTGALSQTVADLQGSVQGLSTALDQAKADIAGLKDAVAQGSAGDGAAVQALNQKVTELEASLATLKDVVAKGGAGDDASVQALDQKLADLQAAVTAIQQTGDPRQSIDAVSQKLAALEGTVTAASDAAKAGEVRIAALEQSVASLSEQVASQAGQPKVALAIAGAALKSAIERGGAFTAEVETFAAIAPNAPELPALREIAAKGVASRSELAGETDDAANAMIAASQTLPEDAGFWDRLWASAESLVKVRPIGAVEGESVPAKVARMEVAVKAGDFARALAEYDTLPETSKAAGQSFADKIRMRLNAEELVAKALAGALKA